MIPDKVLYTDGHDVTVTDSTFRVKSTSYSLKGIIKYGLLIMRPQRLPGILLLLLGLILVFCGFIDLFPANAFGEIRADEEYINANTLVMSAGAALMVIGTLVAVMIRERYAVRIATAEGEKNAVVSHRKEYIAQIVNALNEALRFERPDSGHSFIAVKE
ncbi:MAG TPA: DUF6232 family protein [Ohtaekwangia sp.]|uniref:DUF6232 family protein n=1 Tax=Ohtaekwangia sp. TaxID=2066019 RepID=UPI002F9443D7